MAAIVAVLGLAPFSRGQAAADAPPSPTVAMQLFRTVEAWTRAWSVPPEPEVPPWGVCVALRLDGAVAGRGQSNPGPRAVAAALSQAMTEAAARLPIERDALHDENVRANASRMTLSLELAGPLVPITVESWESAALDLAWGLDGVAVRFGEQTAAMFPGAMLTAPGGGMDPGRALAACVSKASGDPTLILKKPADIAKNHGAVYYRFRVTHLAQAAPNAAPDFLHRGGRVVDTRAVTEKELRAWADQMAEHLLLRRWPGAEKYGVQGAYDPVTAKHDPVIAPPLEQALAIRALTSYSGLVLNERDHSGRVREAVRQLWDSLEAVEPGETSPWEDPAAVAVWFGAVGPYRPVQPDAESIKRFHTVIDAAYTAGAGFAPSIPASSHAMVAGGVAAADYLTALSAFIGADEKIDALSNATRGRSALADVFRSTPPGGLVAQMPWLGYGELMMSAMLRKPEVDPASIAIPSAVALREMRRQTWEHQLRAENLPFDQRDLAGGIVFTASRAPLPGAQCARPLAFIATMLGDPRLTEDAEVAGELARLLVSLRFLRQLTADDAEGWMYTTPARARGGVRTSLWDQRMPVEATALTLMAVCDAIHSINVVKRRRAQAPPTPAPPPG